MNLRPEKIVRFTTDALSELNIPVVKLDNQRYLLTLPQEGQRTLECGENLSITFDKEYFQQSDDSNLEFITPGSPVLSWLIEQVRKRGSLAFAEMDSTAQDASELLGQVTSRYRVDGGSVDGSGLRLSDSSLVHLDYLLRLSALETRDRLFRLTLDEQGQVLTETQSTLAEKNPLIEPTRSRALAGDILGGLVKVAEQKLDEVRRREEAELAAQMAAKRRAEEEQLRSYFEQMRNDLRGLLDISSARNEKVTIEEQIESVERQLRQRLSEVEDRYRVSSETRPLAALVVGCKVVEGEVVFVSGDHRAKLPVRVPLYAPEPPPFVCPKTGKATYNLAATSDGGFIDAGFLGVCAESGRRLPKDELVACAATSKLFCPAYVRECPVTLKKVHHSAFVRCPECLQSVSVLAMVRDTCRACAERRPVSLADGRLQRVAQRYPKLKSWSSWELSETRDIYNLQMQGRLSLARVVIAKTDWRILVCSKRNRLFGSWKQVAQEEVV